MAHFSEFEIAQQVEERLEESGQPFSERTWEDLDIPPLYVAESAGLEVPFRIYGNRDAEHLLIAPASYGCRVDDPSQIVRHIAQQEALGPDVCLVALQVYEPGEQELSDTERKAVATGSFLPYADRVLTVVEGLRLRDDQHVGFYGFSMGADVSIETVYQMINDPQRGIRPVDRLGAIEPARSMVHSQTPIIGKITGAIAMGKAFEESGMALYENVLASRSPALLEARGIDPDDFQAREKHMKHIKRGVMADARKDLKGNIANVRGFATNTSLKQLNTLIEAGRLPKSLIGRMKGSSVCPPEFMDALLSADSMDRFEISGDHSAVDNIRTSAGFTLRLALL